MTLRVLVAVTLLAAATSASAFTLFTPRALKAPLDPSAPIEFVASFPQADGGVDLIPGATLIAQIRPSECAKRRCKPDYHSATYYEFRAPGGTNAGNMAEAWLALGTDELSKRIELGTREAVALLLYDLTESSGEPKKLGATRRHFINSQMVDRMRVVRRTDERIWLRMGPGGRLFSIDANAPER